MLRRASPFVTGTPALDGRGMADADPDRIYTAALLVIGDEILSGRTQDANLAYLAKWLGVQGIRLIEARVITDDHAAIGGAVTTLSASHDYLFTTGGIGPTHDDITVDAVAAALGVEVVVHPGARAILEKYYGDKLTDARLRMARVPEGAELIENSRTGAPGIRHGNIFIMAGVPAITRGMLAALEGKLQGGKPVLSRTVAAWTAESAVAATLAEVEKAHPGAQIGSYPFWREGRTGANFVIRATDPALLDTCAAALLRALTDAGLEPLDGEL